MLRLLVLFLSICVVLNPIAAQVATEPEAVSVPRLLRYTGNLEVANATVGVTFSLYAEQNGGNPLWLETQNVVTDQFGRYTVLVGATSAEGLPVDLFTSGQARWMGIKSTVAPEEPRVLLVSVPYALRAGDAATVGGLTAEQLVAAARPAVVITQAASPVTVTLSRSNRTSRSGDSAAAAGPRGTLYLNSTPAVVVEGYDDAAHDPLPLLLNPQGGNVGVGTANPTQKLSVAGIVESTSGGFKFPDGTTQASAISLNNLNASNLTSGTVPSARLSGTYSGALVFNNAGNVYSGNGGALNNVNASALNGVAPSSYARRDAGNSFTGDQSVSGKLGVGVSPSAESVEVAGNVKLTGAVKFSDGTTLSSAAALIPAGFTILGSSATPPANFTQTGWTIGNGQPWTTKASMPTRRNAGAIGVVNGKIYYIGGHTDDTVVNTVEEYDPTSNSWTTKAPMPTARCLSAYATLNGKIYVFSGCADDSCMTTQAVEEFTPSSTGGSGTWATKATMPYGAQAPFAASVGSKIYVMGGATVPNSVFTNAVYEYDPVADTYKPMSPMAVARDGAGTAVVDGKIYVVGGYGSDSSARIDQFDPAAGATGTWTQESSLSISRFMPAVATVDGFVYVYGGLGVPVQPNSTNVVSVGEIYSPASNSVMMGPAMHVAKTAALSAVVGNKIYFVGGYIGGTGAGITLGTNELFDPAKVLLYLYTKN